MGNKMSAELKFTCPYCFQRISSEDDVSGQMVECPSCSHHFTATHDQIPSAAISNPPKVPPPPAPAQEKARNGKTGTPGWLWPTVAGVVATAVVGGLIAMVAKPTPQIDAAADDELKLSEITPDSLEPGADETGSIIVNDSSPSSAGDFIANPVGRTPPGDYDQNAELEQRMRESDRMQSKMFGVSEEEVRQAREAAMETMMKKLSR